MQHELLDSAEQFNKRHRHRRLWKKIVSLLGCIVVFCTTYALILPAITMEKETFCGKQEHTHEDSCYEIPMVEVLSCNLQVHSHLSECYDAAGAIQCGYANYVIHQHGELCYDEEGTLCCTLPERYTHAHGEECYEQQQVYICGLEETEEHVHTDDCVMLSEPVPVCEREEITLHEHTAACLDSTGNPICGQPQVVNHTHGDECLGETPGEPVLICELEEHVHDDELCYIDRTADVETADIWEATLPDELTRIWPEDILLVAESQLGYTESDSNYVIDEDGTHRGYTRYGEWYGDHYGHWCAMFVSFCLNYAGIEPEDFPYNSNCQAWIGNLKELELYNETEEYIPSAGNLIFFDWDGDGISDHVGLVTEYIAGDDTVPAMVKTIEGNSGNTVRYQEYQWDDADIMGYGILSEQKTYCGIADHAHAAECYMQSTEVSDAVEHVEGLIEKMPSADEIDEAIRAFEEAEDYESEEEYCMAVYQQVCIVYKYYTRLSAEQQASVSNADKLLELEYIWSMMTLELSCEVLVTAVNSYAWNSGIGAVIVHSDSGTTVGNAGMVETDFLYWYAVVVEPVDGHYRVTEFYPEMNSSKSAVYASGEGFILLYHTATLGTGVNVEIGNYVKLSSEFWKSTHAYDGTVHGTVTFSDTIPVGPKEEKDNTAELNIIKGADTSQLVEINLFNYSSNINDLYNSDNKYPGFQQDGGTYSIESSFGYGSFNFGNSITEDLAALNSDITEGDGAINQTTDSYNGVKYGSANLPIEGAMSSVLVDGYPALADGTSLSYLFSDNEYAARLNTKNISGLFQFNENKNEYSFNSRENHAQYDEGTDTFTLYRQILTSNFMMYPFGNFLPLNDITKESAQASTIDRNYLQSIAESAAFKYIQGYGDEYNKLSELLTAFIELMDETYGSTDWEANDLVNQYFKTVGLDQTFTDTLPTLPNGNLLMDELYSIDYDEETNFFFGMEIKMNLHQPKNGLTGKDSTEPMEFYFTGDDDVWIYIDGVLFLDLSGIHRHVGGKIDFVNGLIHYYNLDIATGDVATEPYKTVTFEEAFRAAYEEGSDELYAALAMLNEKGTFIDYSTHKFQFYYAERGAGSGVCRMNFNFPLIQQNTIRVEKELSQDEEEIEVLGDQSYPFQVLSVARSSFYMLNSLFVKAGTPYTLYDSDNSIIQQVVIAEKNLDGSVKTIEVQDGEGNVIPDEQVIRTDEDGIFYLKAGQKAEFVAIEESAGMYYVRELLDEIVLPQYSQISVSGNLVTYNGASVGGRSFTGADSPVTSMENDSAVFRYDNRVDTSKLGSLSITKVLDKYSDSGIAAFDMHVQLDSQALPAGTGYYIGEAEYDADGSLIIDGYTTEEGIITVPVGETVTIPYILSGTQYEVVEAEESAEAYLVIYQYPDESTEAGTVTSEAGAVGIVRDSSVVDVVVTNTETGTLVEIPIQKVLNNTDGKEHSFTFSLINSSRDDPTNDSLVIPVTVGADGTGAAQIVLNYRSEQLEAAGITLPYTFTYTVSEQDDGEQDVVYDSKVYTVEVTVNSDMSASVTVDGTETETPELTFTNELLEEFTITKIVEAESQVISTAVFDFQITLTRDGIPLTGTYESDAGTITLDENGQAVIKLKHGMSVTIRGIPAETDWTVEELYQSEFRASYLIGDSEEAVMGSVAAGQLGSASNSVTFINTATYALPETGGIGTGIFTVAGMLLIAIALVWGFGQKSKRERRLE